MIRTSSKTLLELLTNIKETYKTQYQQRQMQVNFDLEESTLIGGLNGYLLLITTKNSNFYSITTTNKLPHVNSSYPEERILHKFTLKDGYCVGLFFSALTQEWDTQWKLINKYIDTFYFFK
jgi:hypothetical protein